MSRADGVRARSAGRASIAFCRTKGTCMGRALVPNAAAGGKEGSMKRFCRLEVRLSQEEYDTLQRDRQKCNLTQSQYLRSLIMRREIRERLPIDYHHMLTEISRIGNNLNQIARIANQHPDKLPDLASTLALVQRLYERTLECVQNTHQGGADAMPKP